MNPHDELEQLLRGLRPRAEEELLQVALALSARGPGASGQAEPPGRAAFPWTGVLAAGLLWGLVCFGSGWLVAGVVHTGGPLAQGQQPPGEPAQEAESKESALRHRSPLTEPSRPQAQGLPPVSHPRPEEEFPAVEDPWAESALARLEPLTMRNKRLLQLARGEFPPPRLPAVGSPIRPASKPLDPAAENPLLRWRNRPLHWQHWEELLR